MLTVSIFREQRESVSFEHMMYVVLPLPSF